ncbi:hypothetical protein PybrP1_005279 [[Pythium] brassicae (nom. inval.)]|nr:hypothetical protein PybrP1_005279 [[Pythium] brassicae (nom. inval.)]
MHPLAAIAAANAPPARDWSEDEREMMCVLLLGASPSGVDEHHATAAASPTSSLSSLSASSSPPPPTPTTTSGKRTALPKGGKAKLSALDRRAKHREVVRRSYHRNKAVLTDLKDTVKQLEAQMTALEMQRVDEQQPQQGEEEGAEPACKRLADELAAQAAQLQSEAAQLRQTLRAHRQFVTTVYSASTSSDGSSDEEMEADEAGNECVAVPPPLPQRVSPWREAETSDEDFSPDKRPRSKFFSSPVPAGVAPAAMSAPSSSPPPPVPAAAMTARWSELGFRPLSLAQARVFVGETYEGILRFSLSGRAVSSGARVMGWEDRRVVDGTTVKFSLRKQFVRESADRLMAETWQCFSDPECSDKKFRGLMTLEILQRVNDDTIVALRDTVNPNGETVFRCIYLLFRVRTRSGFLICTRSVDRLCVGERERRSARAADGRAVHWVELFGWFVFDQLGDADASTAERFRETGAQIEYGGSVDFGDASVLEAVARDTLATVTRWESFMVTPSFRLPAAAAN